jgi:hypothetical protein
MKSSLPTSGANPRNSNSHAQLKTKLAEAAKSFQLVSEKGRIARKRKKHIYKAERQAYTDLLVSVMIELAERKLREKQGA